MNPQEYRQRRDKILDDVYAIGKTDQSLGIDDYKTLKPGVLKALDALFLELIGYDEPIPETHSPFYELAIDANKVRAQLRNLISNTGEGNG